MAKLLYITNMSLDGYIEDRNGSLNWSDADQVHAFATELVRPIGTFLYGRRLYETMAYWDGPVDGYPQHHREFARVWQTPQKVVFSRTLNAVKTRKTRLVRDFDLDTIRALKTQSDLDISIGGAQLAGVALEGGVVDECHLLVHPVILGAGKPAFAAHSRREFKLVDMQSIGTGAVHLHYRAT